MRLILCVLSSKKLRVGGSSSGGSGLRREGCGGGGGGGGGGEEGGEMELEVEAIVERVFELGSLSAVVGGKNNCQFR